MSCVADEGYEIYFCRDTTENRKNCHHNGDLDLFWRIILKWNLKL